MECDGVLLNLEFIDFSGNFHSEQMIWDLLETHTTLRYLCFFGGFWEGRYETMMFCNWDVSKLKFYMLGKLKT